MVRDSTVEIRSNVEKARYLQDKAVADALSPDVIWWGRQFADIVNPWDKANAILRFVSTACVYVKDPGVEVLDGSAVVLGRGHGDCDAKARLFVALCLVCGITARTLPVFVGERFPHIRAEVFLDGVWWVADPCIVNSTIGVLPVKPETSWRKTNESPW